MSGLRELMQIGVRVARVLPLLESRPSAFEQTQVAPSPITKIAWRNVTLSYSDHIVLCGIDTLARRAEVVAFAGPNGAGKTTMLAIALGVLVPTSGRFCVGDLDLKSVDVIAWQRSIRYLPQRPYVPPRRSIRYAMAFPAFDIDDDAMKRALSLVSLSLPLDTKVDSLSAGERQRLALARLLSSEGDVYLLDEPDANLDSDGIAFVAHTVRDLAARKKIVVVAAHSEVLLKSADHVIALGKKHVNEPLQQADSADPTVDALS